MEDARIKCLTSYLRSLTLNEPFKGNSPPEKKLKERKTKQTFADGVTTLRERIERCSNDFCYFEFNDTSMADVLPPVTISFSETSGRFLRASRDIEAGETIFWEPPLVLAPKGGSGPTCLDCFLSLTETNWPICQGCKSPRCEECCDGNEHSTVECEILSSAFIEEDITTNINLVKKLNIILTPLRTYLAIHECPSAERLVEALQSNVTKRKKSSIGEFIEKYVVHFFRKETELNVSSEFVHHVCGVFDTNAFEVTLGDKKQARALLPLASLMNHSCISNTQHWFLGGHCVVRASVPIHRGDPVTNTYTHSLWGTKARQSHLALTKFFTCDCLRCQDPSELGTHLSSVRCQNCKAMKGYLIPRESNSDQWICDCCGNKMESFSVMNIIKVASNFVSRAETMDTEDIAKTLRKLNMILGRQNYTSIKLLFIYIRKVIETLDTAKEHELLAVLPSIDFLMQITSKIESGLTRLKGVLLLDKLKVTTELVSRRCRQTLSGDHEMIQNLLQNKELIQELDNDAEECENILKWDTLLEHVQKTKQRWAMVKQEVQRQNEHVHCSDF